MEEAGSSMPLPDFFSLVRTQRAHRAFADRPVSDAVIGLVLEAATYAPSAENRQPWEFVVVRDPQLRARIGDLTRRVWDERARDFARRRLAPGLFADVEAGATGGVSRAPVLVVVAADTERGLAATIPSSIFPAVQNLLLAATALGLGSALTTLTTGAATELREIVEMPEHVVPVAVIPLGLPARNLGPPRREPVSAHTHRDRFGTSW